jgi:hypothetical protein
MWVPVLGFEGVYLVNAMSGLRRVCADGYTKVVRTTVSNGCRVVTLSANGKKKTTMLRRVVYEAFRGEIPEGHYIDHVDGNPLNCDLENLYVTFHKKTKRWTHEEARKIRELKAAGFSDAEILRVYGGSPRQLKMMLTGKTRVAKV